MNKSLKRQITVVFGLITLAFLAIPLSGKIHSKETKSLNASYSDECLPSKPIVVAASQPDLYIDYLQEKNIALVVNQTSLVNGVHLADYLLSENIRIKKIFAAEHGIRGDLPDGVKVNTEIDEKTGIPIVSLYGSNKKPQPYDMQDIDILVFDIQDVGCRFYTYLSTLHYVMESCAENHVKLLVLDRPNPNGDYIDGGVLKPYIKSFVGMHPIPVVHGCTLGEMAQMINGEGWLANGAKCELQVVPVANYSHSCKYEPAIKPSPNLPNYQSIRLYPSLCFFEATNISIGRGTFFPFQCYGYPDSTFGSFEFLPQPIKNMSSNPPQEGKRCYGYDLREVKVDGEKIDLSFILNSYSKINDPAKFWSSKRWINLLSGDTVLYHQINAGMTEDEIRKTWSEDLKQYKKIRKKYLLYPDFE